jgi:pyruvate/2-oxoglutarate dehydrogenase complex dihydrolipoamide dehydrogenase (E3) component
VVIGGGFIGSEIAAALSHADVMATMIFPDPYRQDRCATRTFADWQEENRRGVICYLKEGRVRGAMMCDVWGKVDEARQLIRKDMRVSLSDLRGAIR